MHRWQHGIFSLARRAARHPALYVAPCSVAVAGSLTATSPLRCASKSTAAAAASSRQTAPDIWTTGSEAGGETLACTYDTYGGVVIDSTAIPRETDRFRVLLAASLAKWRAAGKCGIWLELPAESAELIPIATKEHGFIFHAAEASHITLKAWLPTDRPSTLPGNASHTIGVGAIVVDESTQPHKVLLVRERNGPAARLGIWKLPTGLVDAGEEIHEAAVREVLEETGIKAEFVDLRAFRMAHGGNLATKDKSNLFFVARLRAQSQAVVAQESEIAEARWFTFDEYAAKQPPRGSAYELLNRSALESGAARLVASEEAIGFRPGSHWVYMPADGPKAAGESRDSRL